MSAIMRPRRSLIRLSLIEGSCPEVGVWNPQSSGRDARHVIAQLIGAHHSPLAQLRAQRSPARAGSFLGPLQMQGSPAQASAIGASCTTNSKRGCQWLAVQPSHRRRPSVNNTATYRKRRRSNTHIGGSRGGSGG